MITLEDLDRLSESTNHQEGFLKKKDIQQYITVADARTELSKYKKNEFGFLFSRWFLCCIDEADIPDLISEMNRVSKSQVHILMTHVNETFYSKKTPEEWLNYDWDVGTILIPEGKWEGYLTKIS